MLWRYPIAGVESSRERGGGGGKRRGYSPVCIRRGLHQHIALVSLTGWMLADAGGNWLCSKEAKTLFSPIPYNPERLEIHFFFYFRISLRHPGNGLARLEIDWRMQFTVFFFFFFFFFILI